MYVNNLIRIRVKGNEIDLSKIDNGEKQRCAMGALAFHYVNRIRKEMKIRSEILRGREIIETGCLIYAVTFH